MAKNKKRLRPARPTVRREVSQQDQPLQSSDKKYYASRQGPSAIQRSIADSTLKDPNALKPVPTPRSVDPKVRRSVDAPVGSSDRYYANDGKAVSQPLAKQTRQHPLDQIAKAGEITHVLIYAQDEIPQKMRDVVTALQQGAYQVRVGLADRAWLRQARQVVEFATTREQISEEQSWDVVFGVIPAAKKPAAPTPVVPPAPVAEEPVAEEPVAEEPENVVEEVEESIQEEPSEEQSPGETEQVPDEDESDG